MMSSLLDFNILPPLTYVYLHGLIYIYFLLIKIEAQKSEFTTQGMILLTRA